LGAALKGKDMATADVGDGPGIATSHRAGGDQVSG